MLEGSPSPEKKILGVLHNGEKVFDREVSHVHYNQSLETYLSQALSRIEPVGKDFIIESIDFGEIIGGSNCVETTDKDEIVFAQRPKRQGLTRFVKHREKEPTSELTIILKKVIDGYEVVTAFMGPRAEPEPWDKNATEDSIQFWGNHALVWGSEEVIPGTEVVVS